MRWTYLAPRLLILAIVWSFFAFTFDPLLRRGVIVGGEAAAGARVELDRLGTSFFPPKLTMTNVAVASRFSPGTNLVEFDDLSLALDGDALLRKSFVVNEGKVSGLQWGTPRNNDGRLEKALPAEPAENSPFTLLGEKAAALGEQAFDGLLDLAKAQLDPETLESFRLARQKHLDWDSRFRNLKARSDSLRQRTKAVEAAVKAAGNKPLDRIETYRKAAIEVEAILQESQRLRQEMQQLPATAQGDFRDVDTARQRDVERARDRIAVFRLDGETLSEALLGRELADRLAQSMLWLDFIRGQFAHARQIEQPQRWRGVDVVFRQKQPLPTLLVRRLDVSGETEFAGEPLAFAGTVTHITTDPVLLGKPTVIRIAGHGTNEFTLQATIDRTAATPVDEVQIVCTMPQQQLSLGRSESLALVVSAEKTELHATLRLEGDRLDGNVLLSQSPVAVKPQLRDGTEKHLRQAMESILADVRQLETNVTLSGTIRQPRWHVRSNLGPTLADGLNGFAAREIQLHQQQLAARIDELLAQQNDALAKLLDERYGELLADLNLNENTARQLVQQVAGKPLPVEGLNRLLR